MVTGTGAPRYRKTKRMVAGIPLVLAMLAGPVAPPAEAVDAGGRSNLNFTLDQVLAAGMTCGTSSCTLAGQVTIRHRHFGRGNVVRLAGSDGFSGGIGFITKSGRLAWRLPTTSLMWYSRSVMTDHTGNVLTTYGGGGPGEFVLVLHPTRRGFDHLGTASMALGNGSTRGLIGADGGIGFKDLNGDKRLEILLYDRIPVPDGGFDGEKLAKVYRWNGQRYIT